MVSSVMVASGRGASAAPVLMPDHATARRGKSAAILRLPVAALPPIEDYAKACARLIAATFPARSQRAGCQRAAQELRIASADTFDRILSGETQRIDAYLMQAVKTLAHMRGVPIPPELAVRQ